MSDDYNERKKDESRSKDSAHDRIVADYFSVTSEQHYSNNYEDSTAGLKRGLGEWINVHGKRVVDLGCGTGELCWLASDLGAKSVVGVNLSKEEIQIASENVEADFVCQDIYSYLSDCPSESTDVIYAMNILEHLNKNDLVDVLEVASRCLTKGGSLIAMVPNATSSYGAMTRYWDFTHLLSFTPSSVAQLMRLTGFSAVEFKEWGPRVHGIASFIRYLLWQVIRSFTWIRLFVETGSGKGNVYTADMIFKLTK